MRKVLIVLLLSIFFSSQSFALECYGTEPFWSANISESNVDVTMMAEEKSSFPITKVDNALGFNQNYLQVYSNNNGPVATVILNKCDDGMSDNTYPREIIIYTGNSVLYGCCGKASK